VPIESHSAEKRLLEVLGGGISEKYAKWLSADASHRDAWLLEDPNRIMFFPSRWMMSWL
jgi:hypothetical protein